MLPSHGYAAVFERILDPNIRVSLKQPFDRSLARGYLHCFNSAPIDESFDERFGPLPYRSIRFHHEDVPNACGKGYATVTNFTDGGRFTRETDWGRMPAHRVSEGPLKTVSEPNVTFIGRCGTYQYLDMHQVINQSLMGVRRWIRTNG